MVHANVEVFLKNENEAYLKSALDLLEAAAVRALGHAPGTSVHLKLKSGQDNNQINVSVSADGVRRAAFSFGVSVLKSDEIKTFLSKKMANEMEFAVMRLRERGDHGSKEDGVEDDDDDEDEVEIRVKFKGGDRK